MNLRFKPQLKKRHLSILGDAEAAEIMLREATNLLHTLEDLRREIIARDEVYLAAKHSGDKEQMENYHKLASAISQKCLDYGRELCEQPVPHWVTANLPNDKIAITKHSYDVIRNKLCVSLNVFDNDLLPNARALIDFAEGRI